MKTITHQGSLGKYPGNTLAAIQHALKNGAEAIEFDVNWCKSGELVLFHDLMAKPDGYRRKARLSQLTLDEVQSIDLGEGHHAPTFEETLDFITNWCEEHNRERPLLFIEPKFQSRRNPGVQQIAEAAKDAVENKGWSYDQMPFVTQNYFVLQKIRAHNPDVKIGASMAPVPRKIGPFRLSPQAHRRVEDTYTRFAEKLAREMGMDYLNAEVRTVTDRADGKAPKFVERAKEAGMKISVWGADQVEHLERASERGITLDCAITKKHDELRTWVERVKDETRNSLREIKADTKNSLRETGERIKDSATTPVSSPSPRTR
ncbi:MAG: glycerophosphodiester phosphodiesterase [Rickettsiales bacterium]